MHVRYLVLALALAAAPAAAQERPAFTLDEAIRLAEQSRPSAVRAFGSVRSAEASRRSAFGSWLPNSQPSEEDLRASRCVASRVSSCTSMASTASCAGSRSISPAATRAA